MCQIKKERLTGLVILDELYCASGDRIGIIETAWKALFWDELGTIHVSSMPAIRPSSCKAAEKLIEAAFRGPRSIGRRFNLSIKRQMPFSGHRRRIIRALQDFC